MHRIQELVRLYRLGEGPVRTARLLGLDRKTERKYRNCLRLAGLLEGPTEALPELVVLRQAIVGLGTPPEQERSSVERWAEFVAEKVRLGLGPTAIHGLLLEERSDYVGSLSAIKRLCKRLKKAQGPRPEDVAIPVHTAVGQVAQVDFGYIGRLYDPVTKQSRKAWVFVMVLGYSRMLFARVVFDQSSTTWLELHRQSFAFFGGVPAVVVPDNLKSAVIQAAFAADEMGSLHRSYGELARHYGFAIDPTPAYSPEKKGKVESAVKFTKGSFFTPRKGSFSDVDDANRRLDAWVRDTANPRTHGTTGRRPTEVFEAEESAALLPLPTVPFVVVLWQKATVGRNSHVTLQRRFYSVPWVHINKSAWLKVRGGGVTIYVDDERVADHALTGETSWSTREEHLPEGRRDFAKRDPEHWYARAEALGADVGTYVRAVMGSDEVHHPLRRVQAIVRTLEGIPVERAQSVARRASRFACYRPDAVRRILAKGLDEVPAGNVFVASTWASDPKFARQADEFLRTWEVTDGDV